MTKKGKAKPSIKQLIGILRAGVPNGDWMYEEENLLYCIDGGYDESSKILMKGGWHFRNAETGQTAYLTGRDDGIFRISASQLKIEIEEAH